MQASFKAALAGLECNTIMTELFMPAPVSGAYYAREIEEIKLIRTIIAQIISNPGAKTIYFAIAKTLRLIDEIPTPRADDTTAIFARVGALGSVNDLAAAGWPPAYAQYAAGLNGNARAGELAAARAMGIGEAWWLAGSDFGTWQAAARRHPDAAFRVARAVRHKPEGDAAFELAALLGSHEAEIEIKFRAKNVAALQMDRSPYAELRRLDLVGGSAEQYAMIARSLIKARKRVGHIYLRAGRYDDAAQWYGPHFAKWRDHAYACMRCKTLGRIEIIPAGKMILLNIPAPVMVANVQAVALQLVGAACVRVIAPQIAHASITRALCNIPHEFYC